MFIWHFSESGDIHAMNKYFLSKGTYTITRMQTKTINMKEREKELMNYNSFNAHLKPQRIYLLIWSSKKLSADDWNLPNSKLRFSFPPWNKVYEPPWQKGQSFLGIIFSLLSLFQPSDFKDLCSLPSGIPI